MHWQCLGDLFAPSVELRRSHRIAVAGPVSVGFFLKPDGFWIVDWLV